MNEDFLHFIWKFQQFDKTDLVTDEGEKLQIIQVGFHNQDAGPDFLNARIKIGNTRWAGNVEIHINSQDWEKHQHQHDPAYANVILHVVYSGSKPVRTSQDRLLPTLSLVNRIDYNSFRKYKAMAATKEKIPCQAHLEQVPSVVKSATVEKAAIERLDQKSQRFVDYLNQSNGDLEQSFYRALARNFGFKVNAVPFEQLAIITPVKIVRNLWHSPFHLEALLLGQAGFLQEVTPADDYEERLITEYRHLAIKFKLTPMPVSAWKFMRLRPQNFPVLRIVQFAHFYHHNGALVQKILEDADLETFFSDFEISITEGYWFHHYRLQDSSGSCVKSLGKTSVKTILINTIVPFLFAMGHYYGSNTYTDKAVELFEKIEPEDNRYIRKFTGLGFKNTNALQSQGLLQLYNFYCTSKKCLNCGVGAHILKHHATASKSHL